MGALSTRSRCHDEIGLPRQCLHRLRPTLRKRTNEGSHISRFHRKGRLLIRFSRLGRDSNTFSAAEATVSWKLLDPVDLREQYGVGIVLLNYQADKPPIFQASLNKGGASKRATFGEFLGAGWSSWRIALSCYNYEYVNE